jgi:chaperonin GroES
MNWEPLGNRVIIKLDEEAGQTKGGILLPDEAKRKPQRGTVVAVGPGELRKTDTGLPGDTRVYFPMHVAVGDVVLVARYAGADLGQLQDEELKGYTIVSEQDILCRPRTQPDAVAKPKR